MKHLLPALLLGVGLSTAPAPPAAAYPVDCAILLCLAGGWPVSAECAHARAIFIARITPWPVEPPLQIWNCPMRASLGRKKAPMEQLFGIASRQEGVPRPQSSADNPAELHLAQDQADVDISDPVYDFVRSIHVFQIEYRRHRNKDGDCSTSYSIRAGTYGEQGEFRWKRTSPSSVPRASRFRPTETCSNYRFRGVFVDWTDHEGTYGFEEVRY
jgi:hypothetical protein